MAAKKSSVPDNAAFRATNSSEFLRAAPAELATVSVVMAAAIISTVITTTAMPATHPWSFGGRRRLQRRWRRNDESGVGSHPVMCTCSISSTTME
jgi:hypothetical protein